MLIILLDDRHQKDATHWKGAQRDALEDCIGVPSDRSYIDVVLVSY